MKHLKLLGLLLAVLTTVFSYGQAGAGGDGVIGGDSTASGVIRIVQAEPTIQAETSGRIMTGTSFVLGMAMNVNNVHGRIANESSNFFILDPAIQSAAGGEGGDGSTPNIYQYLLKEYDVNMTTNPDAPSFYFLVMYTGPVGQFSDTLWISAPGVQPQALVFTAAPAQSGGDTTVVGEPTLNVSTTQLRLTGANPATWALASGSLDIYASNISTLQLQMQSGRNILIGDNGSFVPSKTFNLNTATTTLTVNLLLNTVTVGRYTDVLTISAPGTNLQPIEVYVTAVVDNPGGDTTVVQNPYLRLYSSYYEIKLEQEESAFLASVY